MPVTIADLEDAWLAGSTAFDDFLSEWEKKFNAPVAETMVQMVWQKLPPEAHAALRQMSPEAYAQVEEMMRRKP
jgi:TRAP-type C4-dicarboxylate transport system substrate-binding protein